MIETATAFARDTKTEASYAAWTQSARKAVMRLDPSERTAGPIPVFGAMVRDTALSAQGAHNAYAPQALNAGPGAKLPDIAYESAGVSDEYTFDDMLDIINPLQHLPIVGTLYRKFTGDTMKGMSTIIGGTIFGGPIGAVGSTMNVILKDRTGKDLGENFLSMAGFSTGPEPEKKIDLAYEKKSTASPAPLPDTARLEGTTLALANLSEPRAHRNFAAAAPQKQSWNS